MQVHRTLLAIGASALLAATAGAQVLPSRAAMHSRANVSTTLEDFESYAVAFGGAENTNTLSMDENTIANGQGPGLVADGCVYATNSNTLQWNGAGYFGMPSKNFLANTFDGQLIMKYDTPVQVIGFDMYAFQGYADTTVVSVFDGNGVLIYTSAPISVPGPSPVFFGYQAASIGAVIVDSQVWSWSTLIDDNEYGGSGPGLDVVGSCPGTVTVTATGFTPNGNVAIGFSPSTGSFTIPGGFVCAGTTLGLGGTPTLVAVLHANASGTATFSGNLPPGVCGGHIQAVDLTTCATSNVETL